MKLPPRKRLRSRLNFEQLEDRTTPTSSTVTTLLDVVNPNDGVISLREAIIAAEADPAADTIRFASGLAKGTIDLDPALADTGLDNGEVGRSAFNITTPIEILGTGQILSRNVDGGDFRFFFVSSKGNLSLENLELNGGSARGGNGFSGGGGAAGLGGAIFNEGTLTIRSSTLVGNRATGGDGSIFNGESIGGGGGLGGSSVGINGGGPNGGLNNEVSAGNGGFGGGGSAGFAGGTSVGLAAPGGSGGFGGGGGVGTLGGIGGFGGGGGDATTGNKDGSSNRGRGGFGASAGNAFGQGGGDGAGMGGAIFNLAGTVILVNSTITGNSAVGGSGSGLAQALGGGLFNLNGTVNVVNSTFAANTADAGGSIYNLAHDATQGVPSGSGAVATLANSIFVESTKASRDSLPGSSSDDEVHNQIFPNVEGGPSATVNATVPNIANNGGFANVGGTLNAGGLILATRPVVGGTLADNGGLLRTLALTADSQALDAGTNSAAIDPLNSAPLANDERGSGFNRVSGGTVDLGAFEFQVPNRNRPATIVLTSPSFVVVQNGAPGAPSVADPYPEFSGETRVAVGDINRDGVQDFVFSAGDLGGPHIHVISGKDGAVLYNFFAYDVRFRGGVYIATGDLNNDGFSDIITGAGELGAPHVRAFSGKDGTVLADFFAYDPALRTGVTVAVGDVNGDGTRDIVTGPGPKSGSLVKVIDGTKFGLKDPVTAEILPTAVLASFSVYGAGYADGVFLSVGNLDGDRFADIVAGPLVRGATSQSFVYLGKSLTEPVNSFFAEDFSLRVGLRFAIADTNGDGIDELIVVAAPGGGPREIVNNPITGVPIQSIFFADENLRTGFGVGAGNNDSRIPV